jgi:hypothetical protein
MLGENNRLKVYDHLVQRQLFESKSVRLSVSLNSALGKCGFGPPVVRLFRRIRKIPESVY